MGQEAPETEPRQPARLTRPLATSLAVVAGMARLIPHPWNLSPAYAMELFCGARLCSWQAFAIPLATRLVTDILLFPFYLPLLTDPILYFMPLPLVYLSVVINVLLGRLLVRTESPLWIGICGFLGSVQFFLITNFSSWLAFNTYPHTLSGLMACYVAGLVYYLPVLISYLLFSAVLFGAHAWLTRVRFTAERVPAPAN